LPPVTWDPSFFPSDTTSLVLGADADAENGTITPTTNTSARSFTSAPFPPQAGAYSFVVGAGLVSPDSSGSSTPVTLFLASFADASDPSSSSPNTGNVGIVAQQQRVVTGPVIEVVQSQSMDSGSKIWLLKIVLPIVVGVVLLVGVVAFLLYRRRRRAMRNLNEPKRAPPMTGMKRPKKGLMVRKSTIRRIDDDDFVNMSAVEMGQPPVPKLKGFNFFRDELRRQEAGARR
jgi:hypothetical protein